MKISLRRALPIFIFLLFFPLSVQASSDLEVASDANFSNQTTNFTAGQAIYVRIKADNNGQDKHQLNLRDNQYNFLKSYTLAKTGDNPYQFSASLVAPEAEGYYSLEAQVESSGAKTTSVKTIKVGQPLNANVKVNVRSEVNGESVSFDKSPTPSPRVDLLTQDQQPEPNSKDLSDDRPQDNPDINFGDQDEISESQGFFSQITKLVKNLWNAIWPF